VWCLPSRVWRPPHQVRCMHGPAAAFNVYKVALPATRPSSSSIFFLTPPSVGRLVSQHALSTLLAWIHPDSSVGLAAGENLDNIAGLKPKPSISHSRFNTLKCLRQQSFLFSQLDWLRYELSSAPSPQFTGVSSKAGEQYTSAPIVILSYSRGSRKCFKCFHALERGQVLSRNYSQTHSVVKPVN
jgi:hypothetical protein